MSYQGTIISKPSDLRADEENSSDVWGNLGMDPRHKHPARERPYRRYGTARKLRRDLLEKGVES